MSRIEKGFRAAVKAAQQSDFRSHRVGAAIFIGSRLISAAWNQHKSHPKNRCWSRHAEFNVVLGLDNDDLSDATLFVARLTRTNRVSCAKPCEDCQVIITKFRIKNVFYTNHKGELEKLIDIC